MLGSMILSDNSNIIFQVANNDDMEMVRNFVIREHLETTVFSEASRIAQIDDLMNDFPSLYSQDEWVKSLNILCYLNNIHDLDNQIIIGCIGLSHVNENCLEINHFHLIKQYRQRGIGRLLLQMVIGGASFHYHKIFLITLKGILDGAIRLYESEGFYVYKERQSPFYHVIYMELLLDNYEHNQSSITSKDSFNVSVSVSCFSESIRKLVVANNVSTTSPTLTVQTISNTFWPAYLAFGVALLNTVAINK